MGENHANNTKTKTWLSNVKDLPACSFPMSLTPASFTVQHPPLLTIPRLLTSCTAHLTLPVSFVCGRPRDWTAAKLTKA